MTDKQLRENIIKKFDAYIRTDDSDEPYWNIPCGDSFYGTIYEVMSLFTHQLKLAKIEAKIEELNSINKHPDICNFDMLDEGWIEIRLSELNKQKDLLTKENK